MTELRLLPDIDRGYTWSEEWRSRCEARMISLWPRADRQAYYQSIATRRGDDAAKAMGRLVSAIFRGE